MGTLASLNECSSSDTDELHLKGCETNDSG